MTLTDNCLECVTVIMDFDMEFNDTVLKLLVFEHTILTKRELQRKILFHMMFTHMCGQLTIEMFWLRSCRLIFILDERVLFAINYE